MESQRKTLKKLSEKDLQLKSTKKDYQEKLEQKEIDLKNLINELNELSLKNQRLTSN